MQNLDLGAWALLQFAKVPEFGKVKTRMQSQLSAAQCLSLHRRLLAHNIEQLAPLGFAEYQLWLGQEGSASRPEQLDGQITELINRYGLHPHWQCAGDLGARMGYAMQQQLPRFEGVILIGSDCPFVDRDLIAQVQRALRGGKEVVIAPAEDGGYVLLAMSQWAPELFINMPWSQPQLMAATAAALDKAGRRWCQLGLYADIDRPEDLPRLIALNLHRGLA
ncbi:MAG: TIGR04282 family arsenosugar biosynthesis glycosyltransferase [Cellvibrionaceae bacterium]|nr:TIGR04282 family arsenosugar biosynthesis glycosyltransferase [Cellvibrionaceae bacterium]